MDKKEGFYALLLNGLILALFGIMARIMSNYMGDFTQVGARMLMVCIFLLPILSYKEIKLRYKVDDLLKFSIYVLSFPLYIILFTISVNSINVANSFFYLFIGSMSTAYLLDQFVFGKSITARKVFVASLLIIGLLFFIYPFQLAGESLYGVVAGLLSGVIWSISNATRKYYDKKINNWLGIFYQMFFGMVISFILAWIFKEQTTGMDQLYPWFVLVLFAIGNIIVPTLLNYGFRNIDIGLGTIILASQLIFALIFGMIFFNEYPSNSEILGSVFVMLAILIANIPIKIIIR